MREIELKAHVHDFQSVRCRLDSFADFLGTCHKEDVYWRNADSGVQVRIRKEDCVSARQELSSAQFVTYKRKRLCFGEDSVPTELNEEFEFSLDKTEAFRVFLEDAGFSVFRQKEKSVSQWRYGDALLELCNVPPLGDFLEIEILTESEDEATLSNARAELFLLLEKCGIPRDAIEPRYYNDMLAEHDS